jgi:hypothetical protein
MKLGKKLFGGAKALVAKGKAWAAGQITAGKDYLKKKFSRTKEDSPKSATVKKRAHDLLTPRTAQPFKSKAELETVVRQVADELRPEGLKSLTLVPRRSAPGEYDVVAAASAATPVDQATVTNNTQVPARRFLPAPFLVAGVIRRRLYERGRSWSYFQQQIKAWAMSELGAVFDIMGTFPPRRRRMPEPYSDLRDDARAIVKRYHDEKLVPPNALQVFDAGGFNKAYVNAIQFDVDHKVSIAEHWITGGNNTTDSVRHTHTYADNNLQWMERTFNRSKGATQSGDDGEAQEAARILTQPWVGPAFTSDLAEGGKVGAITIDGQPFLDDHGQPIT